jgi:hypothetical protein
MDLDFEIAKNFQENEEKEIKKIECCIKILKFSHQNIISQKSIQTLIYFVKKSIKTEKLNTNLISLVCQCISTAISPYSKDIMNVDKKEFGKILNQCVNCIVSFINTNNEGIF